MKARPFYLERMRKPFSFKEKWGLISPLVGGLILFVVFLLVVGWGK